MILQHWLPPVRRAADRHGADGVMTGVNLLSARSYGEFEFWFASIKVAAIIAFIAIAASYAFGLTAPHGSPLRQPRRTTADSRRTAGLRCWRR